MPASVLVAGDADEQLAAAGLLDVGHQDLAVFQAGHASSPAWKAPESFFARRSKAAVYPTALLPGVRQCDVRQARRSRPASRLPTPSRSSPARGTWRRVTLHPSRPWRSPLPATPPASNDER